MDEIRFQRGKGEVLIFSHRSISLKILPSTRIEVAFEKNGKSLSLLSTDGKDPVIPHFLIVDDQLVDDFRLLPESVQLATVETEFGRGKQLTLKSEASGPKNSTIEKTLEIALYEKYPDATIVSASYENVQSDGPIILNKVFSNVFQLDRRQVDEQEVSHDFWAFFGFGRFIPGGHSRRRVNVLAIEADLDIQNDSEQVSGVPLSDIWAPQMGMAIASIEKRARILKMPVNVDERGYVNTSLLEEPEKTLHPGESYSALRTAIMVHSLDYYDPLRRYADLMADQGIASKPAPEFAYDPFWCNWGYRKDWTLEHGLDRLDIFESLGIKAITIDDGWFDSYGDWFVSRNHFPGGEEQLKKWISQLHSAGLNVVLWWVPGIAGPVMAKKHPDWVIRDREGNMVSSRWSDAVELCPTLPEVKEYHRELSRKFISEFDVDGFKLDGIYVAPRCYNPDHQHESPDESYAAYEDLFKVIYETTMELKPNGDFVLGQCPCGAFASPYSLQWGNRPVVADPPLMTQSTRRRVKAYKALLGPTSCVDNDFHERYNDYFPVEVGAGGLVTTKFTKLSDYEFRNFEKWYGLYNMYRLSSGEYLNLYDIAYDVPETYVIKKEGTYYYTFLKPAINGPEGVPWYEDEIDRREEMLKAFAKELEQLPTWEGAVELRGLEERKYTVYDLETDRKLGEVQGPAGELTIAFKDHLMIRVVPE